MGGISPPCAARSSGAPRGRKVSRLSVNRIFWVFFFIGSSFRSARRSTCIQACPVSVHGTWQVPWQLTGQVKLAVPVISAAPPRAASSGEVSVRTVSRCSFSRNCGFFFMNGLLSGRGRRNSAPPLHGMLDAYQVAEEGKGADRGDAGAASPPPPTGRRNQQV